VAKAPVVQHGEGFARLDAFPGQDDDVAPGPSRRLQRPGVQCRHAADGVLHTDLVDRLPLQPRGKDPGADRFRQRRARR
jgi:hypothetical protein